MAARLKNLPCRLQTASPPLMHPPAGFASIPLPRKGEAREGGNYYTLFKRQYRWQHHQIQSI